MYLRRNVYEILSGLYVPLGGGGMRLITVLKYEDCRTVLFN